MPRVQIGVWAAVAIVALRLGVGLHFFWEGADKLRDPKPYSAGFLGNAKGPLAPMFKRFVWDPEGYARLDVDKVQNHWEGYAQQIKSHFAYDEKQSAKVDKLVTEYEGRYKSWVGGKREEIDEYYLALERRDKNAAQPSRSALTSLRTHDARIAVDRNKLKGEVLPEIDRLNADVENDLNSVATPEQWKRHGRLKIGKVGQRFGDSETVDTFIRWFDVTVGVLLIVGLFTRPVALAAGLFLGSVCLSQWPGSVGAVPIYPQFIEMLALFALAAIGAGHFAGLDFVIRGLRLMARSPKAPAAVPAGARA